MSSKSYSVCELEGHNDEFLNMVCLDKKCNKHQLLCPFCLENHYSCYTPPIKRFLDEFKSQFNARRSELDPNIKNLQGIYDEIQNKMEQTQNKIEEIFRKQKEIMDNIKQFIEQVSQRQKTIKIQQEKLQKFEQNQNQENFKQLLTEIVDFNSNSDRFSFSIKQENEQKLTRIEERIYHGKMHQQQYQSFINNIIKNLEDYHDNLRIHLQNYFLNPPSNNQQQNNINSQQSNMVSQIQTNSLLKQDQQLNPIDPNRTNTNIPNAQLNRSPNHNSSRQSQPHSMQDTNNQQLLNNINPQTILNQYKTTQQPPSTPTLLTHTQQQQQALRSVNDENNQTELSKVLKLTQGKSFQIELNGKKITKLLFLSKQLLAGCCGTQFLLFDLITYKQTDTINVEAEITDAAYMESNDCTRTLYLATNNGKFYTFIIDNSFKQNKIFLSYQVDKIGNLLIQINQQENQIVTFGEEKIIKIWQLQNFKEINRWELHEAGNVLHLNSQYIFVGSDYFLYIWDKVNQVKKYLKIKQTKIISINTHEKKLIVGLQDKLLVYERINENYQLKHEQWFGDISSVNIIKKWSVAIILFKQQQKQQVFIYDYEQYTLNNRNLLEQKATCCAVREFDKFQLVGFIQANGQCVIYNLEQTEEQKSK